MKYKRNNILHLPLQVALILSLLLWIGCNANGEAGSETQVGDDALDETGLPDQQTDISNASFRKAVGDNDPRSCFQDVNLDVADPNATPRDEGAPKLRQLIIAVDASGSMGAKLGNSTKMASAREATLELLDRLPKDVRVGLVAFGHRGDNSASGKETSCAGVETAYSLATPNRGDIRAALEKISPTGWTPLAAAIEEAAGNLSAAQNEGEQVLWVVSDGKETCGGDPVAVARRVNQGNLKLVVNIVGFDLTGDDRAQLQAVAEAGGGKFLDYDPNGGERLAESMWRLQNRIDAMQERLNTTLSNNANAISGIGEAQNCVNMMITNERSQLNKLLAGRATASEAEVEEIEEAKELLDLRHERIRAFRESYVARVRGARDDANEASRANKEEFEKTLTPDGQ